MGKRTGRLAVYRYSREHASEKSDARKRKAETDPEYAEKISQWNATAFRNWKNTQKERGSYCDILHEHRSALKDDPNRLSTEFIEKMCNSVEKKVFGRKTNVR